VNLGFWSVLKLPHAHQQRCSRRIDRGVLLCACLALVFAMNAGAKRLELDNGDVYDGEILDDMRTGQGSYLWADGHRYEGQFVANRMQGEGTYFWPDGRTYQGSFVADKRQGRGLLRWPNGDVYEGGFVDNKMSGTGVFVWANQDRYAGNFVDGKRTGSGEFAWNTGERYVGEFVDGVLQGEGTFEWPDGRRYVGPFTAGRKSGRGVFEWANGNRYVGEFADDARSGLGVFYWRDGTVYQGQFVGDQMHGYGVKEGPDGVMSLQHWELGSLAFSKPLTANPRCTLQLEDRQWMFDSVECINGLAHGAGLAASLDGQQIVVNGRFVLGNLVEGEIQVLRLKKSVAAAWPACTLPCRKSLGVWLPSRWFPPATPPTPVSASAFSRSPGSMRG
jgi:hypothetical protein